MAFEVGTQVAPGGQSPTSPVPFDSDSKATSSQDADLPSPRTLHDVSEVIRAHYRATAQLIEAVYLR